MREDASDENLTKIHDMLAETRPTAINLRWALARMRDALLNQPREQRAAIAWKEAAAIADEDVAMSARLMRTSLRHLIERYAAARQREGSRPEDVVVSIKQLLHDAAESCPSQVALPELLRTVVPWCVQGYYE